MSIILILLFSVLACAIAHKDFMREQARKNDYFRQSEADMGWIANLLIRLLIAAIAFSLVVAVIPVRN